MAFNTRRLQFAGHSGATLAARLDFPNGPLRALRTFCPLLHLLQGFGSSAALQRSLRAKVSL
ncbi:hypothetical protein EV132_101140 [Rhizobium sullae]|uniref:Uncharacterized protein n=1 Tax=Rhizobium sullae TaxID=50338 RepID=A0A4R3QNZ0_RHISU|nr:hypothetical protein EV132_101140 [Rhizobium sullae]